LRFWICKDMFFCILTIVCLLGHQRAFYEDSQIWKTVLIEVFISILVFLENFSSFINCTDFVWFFEGLFYCAYIAYKFWIFGYYFFRTHICFIMHYHFINTIIFAYLNMVWPFYKTDLQYIHLVHCVIFNCLASWLDFDWIY